MSFINLLMHLNTKNRSQTLPFLFTIIYSCLTPEHYPKHTTVFSGSPYSSTITMTEAMTQLTLLL